LRQQNHPDRQRKKTVTHARKARPMPVEAPDPDGFRICRRSIPASDDVFHSLLNEYEIFPLKCSL
jgi:hypothetical protein